MDSGFELLSSRLEEVLEDIIGPLDVNHCVLDVLGELCDQGVVLVGSDVEVEVQITQLFVQVSDQVFDSRDKLINDVTSQSVEFNHVKHGLAPLRFRKLINLFLSRSGDPFEFQRKAASY